MELGWPTQTPAVQPLSAHGHQPVSAQTKTSVTSGRLAGKARDFSAGQALDFEPDLEGREAVKVGAEAGDCWLVA
jgi:hypothetical protein